MKYLFSKSKISARIENHYSTTRLLFMDNDAETNRSWEMCLKLWDYWYNYTHMYCQIVKFVGMTVMG